MLVQKEKLAFEKRTFRLRQAAMDDVTAIVDLLNTCAIDQTGQPDMTRSDLISEWTSPGFSPAESVRLAETDDGEIVGYIEVWDIEPVPVANWVWARVHPDYEGNGIGTSLMKWADERLQRTITRLPEDLRVVYRSSAISTHLPSRELLEGVGMTLNRYFWRMGISLEDPLPAALWPAGISVKTYAEHGDLRAIYRSFNDAFKDHWGHVEQPEEAMIAKWEHWTSTDEEFDPSLWYLAMDGDEIAGVCLCRSQSYEDPDAGYVNILGVRRPWRKQGVALAMLHHAFAELQKRGRERAELGVDAGSLTGATRLYEKAGMHVVREYCSYEKVLRPGRDISLQTLDN